VVGGPGAQLLRCASPLGVDRAAAAAKDALCGLSDHVKPIPARECASFLDVA